MICWRWPGSRRADTNVYANPIGNGQPNFCVCIDNRKSFIPRQTLPICDPPLYITISLETIIGFNRPGVAGAVLQTPLLLTESLTLFVKTFKTSLHPNKP